MSWFVLALGAGLASALNVGASKLLVGRTLRPVLVGGWVHLLGAALTLPLLFFYPPSVAWEPGLVLALLGMGLVYTLGNALYFVALAGVQLSEVDLFLRSSALWTFVGGSVLLAEPLSRGSVFGAALVFASVMMLSSGKLDVSGAWFSRAQWLALAAALVFGLGNVVDKALSVHFDAVSYTAFNLALTGVGMLALGRARPSDLARPVLWSRGAWTVAATFALTQLLIILAFSAGGSAGGVIMVAQVRLVLLMGVGVLMLGERDRLGRKGLAAALMVLGVTALYGAP